MAGRRLGQHFLADKSTLERIAAAACPDPSSKVIEIGPGKGALTERLIRRAAGVIAIEIDQVLVHYLQARFRDVPNLTILHSDILKADLSAWGPVSVAGNLPYYITSPIVEKVLKLEYALENAVFLVQKEVAERMAAKPGNRDYGYLSVQVQIAAEPKLLFTVPPGAFRPPPDVDSAVIQLHPRQHPAVSDRSSFLRFASQAFQHKRKTLRNNLSATYSREAIEAQPEAGLRAEQLSVEQFADLHQRILRFR